MRRIIGFVLALQGCVVPWIDAVDGIDTDDTEVDTDGVDTDDTEVDTDTDAPVGDPADVTDDCPDADTEPLLEDGTYVGTFRGLDVSGLNPDCPSIAAATGVDGYRKLRLAKGKKLTVTLLAKGATEAGDRDVVVTLLSACEADACVRGADSATDGRLETLTYTNETAGPQELWLGVHLFDDSELGGDFVLTVARE